MPKRFDIYHSLSILKSHIEAAKKALEHEQHGQERLVLSAKINALQIAHDDLETSVPPMYEELMRETIVEAMQPGARRWLEEQNSLDGLSDSAVMEMVNALAGEYATIYAGGASDEAWVRRIKGDPPKCVTPPGKVDLEAAYKALSRLVNIAFRNRDANGEPYRPRFCIPARQDDDDLILHAALEELAARRDP